MPPSARFVAISGDRFERMGRVRRIITAAEMDKMSPQERADVVEAGRAATWDDVSDAFRAEVLAAASELGAQRRANRG